MELFQNKAGEAKKYGEEFVLNQGKYPEGETCRWESIDMMEKRLIGVLNKYMDYKKILIVTHGMLMHQIKPYGHIPIVMWTVLPMTRISHVPVLKRNSIK